MIKATIDYSDISRYLDRMARIIEQCVIEEFIEWAKRDDDYLRSNNGFTDHTGNLRSSLGAGVYNDAKLVFSTSFQTVLNGARGSAEGKQALQQMAEQTRGRVAKVMVAGMGYAQEVEDIESKDVLESRRIQCEEEAGRIIERAMHKAEERIKHI